MPRAPGLYACKRGVAAIRGRAGYRVLLGAIVLTVLIACAAFGLTLSAAGRAESVWGRVELRRGAGTFPLRAGQVLMAGDRLTSGRKAGAVLSLGRHRMRLGANASVLILSARETAERYAIFLWLGRLWILVKKTVKAIDFKVETPAAVAGVRGTLFSVSVAPDGTTWVGVAEGLVTVHRLDGGGKVLLAQGYETSVKPGRSPEKPRKCKQGKVGGDDLGEGDGRGKGKDKDKDKDEPGQGHGQDKGKG